MTTFSEDLLVFSNFHHQECDSTGHRNKISQCSFDAGHHQLCDPAQVASSLTDGFLIWEMGMILAPAPESPMRANPPRV